MERHRALKWLNHRLELERKMHRANHYVMEDVVFFMEFIYEKTGKRLQVDDIVRSIRHYPESCSLWVNKLINYLIFTHEITVETEDFSLKILLEGEKNIRKVINYI